MKTIFRFLKSVRLAIVLIAYLAVASLLASLVPQAREGEYYVATYPGALARLLQWSGFTNFFRSPLFFLPTALFFINLTTCAIDRFLRELRKPRKRHGPDLLHFGIMLLCVGALLSFLGRQSGYVLLSKGDAVRLPGDQLLSLSDFAYLAYSDGRPKDWISTVRLSSGAKTLIPAYAIRVNHPLKLGRISIYQVSHDIQRALVLLDSQGSSHSVARGEETQAGDSAVYLVDPGKQGDKALVRVQDAAGTHLDRLGPGDKIGNMIVADIRELEFSGLEAVVDPGYPLVLAALLLAGLGVFITFFQKLRDTREVTA